MRRQGAATPGPTHLVFVCPQPSLPRQSHTDDGHHHFDGKKNHLKQTENCNILLLLGGSTEEEFAWRSVRLAPSQFSPAAVWADAFCLLARMPVTCCRGSEVLLFSLAVLSPVVRSHAEARSAAAAMNAASEHACDASRLPLRLRGGGIEGDLASSMQRSVNGVITAGGFVNMYIYYVICILRVCVCVWVCINVCMYVCI